MQSDVSWFPFTLPKDAWKVQDADEEIFLLYSQLQLTGATPEEDINTSGLGCVDSRQGELSVRIDVQQPPRYDNITQSRSSERSSLRPSKRNRAASRKRDNFSVNQGSLEIQLFQDTTSLRSRKGDTGSVLWRASLELARLLLSQSCFSDNRLLPMTSLSSCHVVELGSGTGLLGIVLAPYVAHYTATDIPSLLPLIRKNLQHNISPSQRFKVTIDDIDWVQLHSTPSKLRHKIFLPQKLSDCCLPRHSTTRTIPAVQPFVSGGQRDIDLIIAVDCIYNPSLIAPLLDTIEYLTTLNSHITSLPDAETGVTVRSRHSPTVLIVLELRAADVSRDFLHAWLELRGTWEIWSVPLLGARFAMWIGRRMDE